MSVRCSDKELIRIIAMFFIVTWHIFLHGGMVQEIPGANIMRGIAQSGVNLFILISGWFSIRLYLRSLLNLYAMIFFYMASSLIVAHCILGYQIVLKDIAELFFPMSFEAGLYWFVSCYFMLMLLSPAINFFLQRSTDKQYLWLLFVLGYLSCFSGIVFNNDINLNGYNTFHFVFIYVLGTGLHRFGVPDGLKRMHWAGIYVLSTVLLIVLLYFAPSKGLRYNNPFLVIASVSLFSFLSSFRFESRKINALARFMFPVYLVQESHCGLYAYDWLYKSGVQNHFRIAGLYDLLLYIIGLLTVAFVVESIRHKLMSPFIDKVSRKLSTQFSFFNNIN